LTVADAGWWLLVQGPTELEQDCGLLLFRDCDAGKSQGAAIANFEFHLHHGDFAQVLEDLPRGERGRFGRSEIFSNSRI
jgi:hypothetical protein